MVTYVCDLLGTPRRARGFQAVDHLIEAVGGGGPVFAIHEPTTGEVGLLMHAAHPDAPAIAEAALCAIEVRGLGTRLETWPESDGEGHRIYFMLRVEQIGPFLEGCRRLRIREVWRRF